MSSLGAYVRNNNVRPHPWQALEYPWSRGDSPMKMRWAWLLPVLTIVTLSGASVAWGQGYPAAPPGYSPAMAYGPGAGYPPAYDPSVAMYAPPGAMNGGVAPAGYYQGEGEVGPTPAGPPPGMMMQPGGSPGGYEMGPGGNAEDYDAGNCPYCGGAGCGHCGGQHGLLGDILGIVGPYPDGGSAAPRWYDLAVDFMYLKRDDTGRTRNFASDGINGAIVLSNQSLKFNEAPSFRFSGMFQVGAGSSVEFTYFGLFNFSDSTSVTSNSNDLFSTVSQFGLLPFNGYDDTDNSDVQSLSYSSTFDNFEVNYRRRWVAPNSRSQGSYLIGVRYFKLHEHLDYSTHSSVNQVNGNDGAADFRVGTFNSLTGIQFGGDFWLCLIPGLRIGAEGKAGVYGNHMGQGLTVNATSLAAPYSESFKNNDVAFIGDATVSATYRFSYNWTGRIGYQFLFVDGVALASENFNVSGSPPFPLLPPGTTRNTAINDDGNIFYHGWTAGVEFQW